MTADLHPDTSEPRPGTCCGACPPIAGGGWDCTCLGLPDCPAAGRAETTTATTEDTVTEAARLIDSCIPDDVPGYRYRYAEQAAQAMASRGLLATARTRPTRDDISDAIERSGIAIGTTDAEHAADAVLSLYADQPTEAEAGARALVHAAGDHFHAMVAAGAGNPSEVSTWLRERAARLRGGDRDE